MKITFLGTGTSQGIPVIACDCAVCTSSDFRDTRLRSSIMVEEGGQVLVIDSGPDFRYQMLRAKVRHLDAILFTHEHKDHIAGLDDVRAFNYRQGTAINVYAATKVQECIHREFPYMFQKPYPGIPRINLQTIENKYFIIDNIKVQPIAVMHDLLPVFGFRIGDFTYITDAKTVAEAERKKIRGSQILVVNALQQAPHHAHFTFDEALTFVEEIGVEMGYFTHIGHRLGKHAALTKRLTSKNIQLAYDQLQLEL